MKIDPFDKIPEKKTIISSLRSLKDDLLLGMIFDKLPVGIEIYDEKGILTKINPAGQKILGTDENKLLGVNIFENPIISDEIKEKIRNGEEADYENNYDFGKIKDKQYYESTFSSEIKSLIGKTIPLKDSYNNIFGYLTLVYDNTDDYKRQKILEYNLTKLRMAMDTGKALIWEYDVEKDILSYDETLTGDISSWIFNNASNSSIFTSKGQLESIHPEDADRLYTQAVMPILNGDIDQVTITYRQYMAGKLEWMTSNFRSLSTDLGEKPCKVFCYTMIITEQRETELELLKIKEADRLKTLFMENLSHEIRTPLNAIIGFSSIIADSNKSNENEEFMKLISENNEILLGMINNMLDLSKLDMGEIRYEYKEFNIKTVGQELYEQFRNRVLAEVKLFFNYKLPFTLFYSDEKRIKQIVSNLLDNAVKFTREGEIILSFEMRDNYLEISVSDTGIGLTEEEKNQLTIPFFKVDSFTKGTGLGLHLSQKLAADLGGTIHIESEKGVGSKFLFSLLLGKNND